MPASGACSAECPGVRSSLLAPDLRPSVAVGEGGGYLSNGAFRFIGGCGDLRWYNPIATRLCCPSRLVGDSLHGRDGAVLDRTGVSNPGVPFRAHDQWVGQRRILHLDLLDAAQARPAVGRETEVTGRWSDRRRFEAMYHSTYPHIAAYCRRRLPIDDVDDTVAEIYTIAWNKRDQFLAADSPLAWLHSVGYRVVSARYRSTKRDRSLREKLSHESRRQPDTPEARAVLDDEVERALALLYELAPRDQELIRLLAFEERSYDEIAAITGLPRSTVRSSLFRIRKRVRPFQDRNSRSDP
ncbi:MAG: sigma-70 family RNA polymerase sigma factor [Actinomycetota bacterium]